MSLEVKVVRTSFGDLIAQIDANQPYGPSLEITKPHIIRLQQVHPSPNDPVGKLQISFAPFMLYSDDETFVVDRVHVICISTPSVDILNAYNSQFGSGIVVPPSIGQSILLKG